MLPLRSLFDFVLVRTRSSVLRILDVNFFAILLFFLEIELIIYLINWLTVERARGGNRT